MYNFSKDPISGINISVFSWLEGIWLGERGKNAFEEHWSGSLAGSMMGMFRWVEDGKANFYEIQTLSEEDSNLVLRIKHFNEDLTGWEEKDQSLTFDLVEAEAKSWIFYQRYTKLRFWVKYEQIDLNSFEVTFMPQDETDKPIKPFRFHRKK